jgi:hypothetical protein
MLAAPAARKLRGKAVVAFEVIRGDLTDEPSLRAPLEGVYGFFAMATPFEKGMENEIAQGKTLDDVSAAAGVGQASTSEEPPTQMSPRSQGVAETMRLRLAEPVEGYHDRHQHSEGDDQSPDRV